MHGHQTAAHITCSVQWRRDVQHATPVVPAAGAEFCRSLKLLGRFFAHHVDDARGVARARGQARCAAQYLDAVIQGHVRNALGWKCVQAQKFGMGADAIELVVGDGVAARIGIGALCAQHRGGDAGRARQHFSDGGEVLILHALLCDHADGLRGITQTHGQTGGDAGGAFGDIRARAFRGGCQGVRSGGHAHLAQSGLGCSLRASERSASGDSGCGCSGSF